MKWAELDGSNFVIGIAGGPADAIATLPGTWVECPYGVETGWQWVDPDWVHPDGRDLPTEPLPEDTYLLTGSQWVERFTEVEWKWLKTRRNDGTAAGDRLDQMMDAIRWTNSINVAPGQPIDEFYEWLLNQGLPGGQTRIDELRAPN